MPLKGQAWQRKWSEKDQDGLNGSKWSDITTNVYLVKKIPHTDSRTDTNLKRLHDFSEEERKKSQ